MIRGLGEGSYAEVYLAENTAVRAPVALKVLRPALQEDVRVVERLRQEGHILFKLSHERIVRVMDLEEVGGAIFLVMEYAEGQPLDRHLAEHRLTLPEAVDVAKQMAAAVAHAHGQGILHRDLKPGNIMVVRPSPPAIKVLDFGLARLMTQDVRLTGTAQGMIGTPAYMAPELLSGQEATKQSDIYSLGLILYELLAGRPAFSHQSDLSPIDFSRYLLKRAEAEVPEVRAACPEAPEALSEVVRRAAAVEPSRRYGSVRELAAALEEALRPGRPTPPAHPTPRRGLELESFDPSRSLMSSRAQDTPQPQQGQEEDTPTLPRDAPAGGHRSRLGQGIALGLGAAALVLALALGVGHLTSGEDAPSGEMVAAAAAPAPPAPEPTPEPEPKPKPPPGMVRIPAGSFTMGSKGGDEDEKPPHEVYLDAYWIDRAEVTVGDYRRCVREGGCTDHHLTGYEWPGKEFTESEYCNWGQSGREDHPVNCVDWKQAEAYCRWANKELPTEAQWERAARGRSGRTYPWGEEEATCRRAVMYDGKTTGSKGDETNGCGEDRTWPVCSKEAGSTPEGICDLAGNVWEWVKDGYDDDYYGRSPGRNPVKTASSSHRVVRGGGWSSGARGLRSAFRNGYSPGSRNSYLGFRCARAVGPLER